MPDENEGTQQQPDNQTDVAPEQDASRGGRHFTTKLLVLAAILAVVLFAAYQLGLLKRLAASRGIPESTTELAPALNRLSPDNSISSAQLLADLGRSPVDPSKVLFPAFEKSVTSDSDKKPKSCPPGIAALPETPSRSESGSASEQAPGPTPPGASRAGADKPLETPVIVSRAPADTTAPSRMSRKKKIRESKAQKSKPEKSKEDTGTTAPGETAAASKRTQTKSPEPAEEAKREQFQLPGSLVVKVRNYSGTFAKWGLMVILDDSAAMARKSKSWDPNRMSAATNLVQRLPEVVTPGSKIAVRDFLCTKSGGKKAAAAPCLSHILYDWADHPFKGLKGKLDNINPGGHTNVCAAAAYAVKKDLQELKDLTPRLLLVTSGSGKCAVKSVLRALNRKGGQGFTRLDVVAFAMPKKREGAYAGLAKKGHGLFLKVEKPADLDQALARYGKVLKTKIFDKIEVKGEKSVFNTALEEEITLPPGSYSIVLPAVAGLSPSKRMISNIKIKSGEAKALEIQVKKGQPVVRAAKK